MSTTDAYVGAARVYDFLLNPFLDSKRRLLASLCKQSGAFSVLDVCCGTARQYVAVQDLGMAYTGCDLSPAMLGQARKNGAEYLVALANGMALPFADAQFDAAIISFALHEKPLQVAEAMLLESARVARKVFVMDYLMADRNIALPGQWLMQIPERIVGGEHWQCYRAYMKAGAIQGMAHRLGLQLVIKERLFLGGAAIMEISA